MTAIFVIGCNDTYETSQSLNSNNTVNLPLDFDIDFYGEKNVSKESIIRVSSLFVEDKPVVLNFWAGLCPPCRAEMPNIQSIYPEYREKVAIFGIDIGPFVGLGTREDGEKLIQNLGITYPTGSTLENEIVIAYEISGMPTTIFLLPQGKLFKKCLFS